MNTYIIFNVERDEKTGILVATWRDSTGHGSITIEGRDILHLEMRVKDAVSDYFEPEQTPESILLYVTHRALHIPIRLEPRPYEG